MKILGISAYFHDAAAVISVDGVVIAAAQEERFSRIKHDAAFPEQAIRFCLQESGLHLSDLDAVVFYEKPFLKFERILESFYAHAPSGLRSFVVAMPHWFGEKLFLKSNIRKALKQIDSQFPNGLPLLFSEHHLSHAASAFYPSGFVEAAILTVDGVGEWATTMIAHGKDRDIHILQQQDFPHSLGLLYSAFTQFLGFKVNSGEYKLMGLAGYGEAESSETKTFIQHIREQIVKVFPDGSIRLHLPYFGFLSSLQMIRPQKWEKLFGMAMRKEGESFDLAHANLALAIQIVCEEILLKLIQAAKDLTKASRLCLAGGVALNCVANAKLRQAAIFDDIYIQPAAGDAGGALGAALAAEHLFFQQNRPPRSLNSRLQFLGPDPTESQIRDLRIKYQLDLRQPEDLPVWLAVQLATGKIVACCRGRMEYGPRALGNRSILADPRLPDMQQRINLMVKKRESFRPFAPVILAERAADYFDMSTESPWMLEVFPLKTTHHIQPLTSLPGLSVEEKLSAQKSDFPAITHADFSARVQTVRQADHPFLHQTLTAFERLTGCPMLVNTSFNERGEPMVCTAEDAFQAFMRTGIDILIVGDTAITREQVQHLDPDDFNQRFQKD
ncbi:MAG: carbamoyltransferase N-terminal domain-containing protein [Bacteroidota bacterium]